MSYPLSRISRRPLAFAILLAATTHPASAQVYLWTGDTDPANPAWSAPNWLLGGVTSVLPPTGPLSLRFDATTSPLATRTNSNDSTTRTISSLTYSGGNWTTTGLPLTFASATSDPARLVLGEGTSATLPGANFTTAYNITVPATSTLTFTGDVQNSQAFGSSLNIAGVAIFEKPAYFFFFFDSVSGNFVFKDDFRFTAFQGFPTIELRRGFSGVPTSGISTPGLSARVIFNPDSDQTYTPGPTIGSVLARKIGTKTSTLISPDVRNNNIRTLAIEEGAFIWENYTQDVTSISVSAGASLTLKHSPSFSSAFPADPSGQSTTTLSGPGQITIDSANPRSGPLVVGSATLSIVRGTVFDDGFTGVANVQPNGTYAVPTASGTLQSTVNLAGGTFRVFGPGGTFGWNPSGTGTLDLLLNDLASVVTFPAPLPASLALSATRGVIEINTATSPLPATSLSLGDSGRLRLISPSPATLDIDVSGTGTLQKSGPGTLTVSRPIAVPRLSISAGELRLLSPSPALLETTLEPAATLRLLLPDNTNLPNFAVFGSGTLIKASPNTITLGTLSVGLTTVEQGTLRARGTVGGSVVLNSGTSLEIFGSGGSGLANISLAPNSRLAFADTLQVTGDLTGAGRIDALSASANLVLFGALSPGSPTSPTATLSIFPAATSDQLVTQFEAGATLDLRTPSDHDRLIIGGVAIPFGPLTLRLLPGAELRPGDTFDLFSWTVFDPSLTFSPISLPDPAIATFDLSQLYTQGTVTVLTAIPEPAAALPLLAAASVLLSRRRPRSVLPISCAK